MVDVVQGDAGARLDRWFKRRYPHLSQGRIQKLLRTGQIRVDGARAKANQLVETGQTIRIPPIGPADQGSGDGLGGVRSGRAPSRSGGVSPKDAQFIRDLVIYSDEHMVVLNKPAGLAVQGGSKTTRHIDGMAAALVDKPGQDPPRLAHRLDRDTSGVLVLGRTPAATAALARAFQSHRAVKTYWAITIGAPVPAEGLLKGFVRKGKSATKGEGKEIMVPARHGEDGAVHARTVYTTIAKAGARAAWVALRPETGRTHQLRLHMSLLGTAILGDRKYTCHREAPQGLAAGLHLHAQHIALPHPVTGQEVAFAAPLPKHMASAFADLGFDEVSYPEDDPLADVRY